MFTAALLTRSPEPTWEKVALAGPRVASAPGRLNPARGLPSATSRLERAPRAGFRNGLSCLPSGAYV